MKGVVKEIYKKEREDWGGGGGEWKRCKMYVSVCVRVWRARKVFLFFLWRVGG